MTDLLVKNGHEITCVDGSEKFAEDIRKDIRAPGYFANFLKILN